MAEYHIFGAGASGLYTAWRLSDKNSELGPEDTIILYEWADYSFNDNDGTREPAGRICTHHYKDNTDNSFVELGGMRFLNYNINKSTPETDKSGSGHRLVSYVINDLLNLETENFGTASTPLLYLRGKHYSGSPPSNYDNYFKTGGKTSYDLRMTSIYKEQMVPRTRLERNTFYANAELQNTDEYDGVYKKGTFLYNIGFWDFIQADSQLGETGFQYLKDSGGYNSNFLNSNLASALLQNGEFVPGSFVYKKIKKGYSSVFKGLFGKVQENCKVPGSPKFKYKKNTKITSIYLENDKIKFTTEEGANNSFIVDQSKSMTADYAFLAMPRHCLEQVFNTTKSHQNKDGKRYLFNDSRIKKHVESVVEQPSYKIAAYFDNPWWFDEDVKYKLTFDKNNEEGVCGPTITDLPLRQIYYFGNNAPDKKSKEKNIHALLASYDDMAATKFWRSNKRRAWPCSLK